MKEQRSDRIVAAFDRELASLPVPPGLRALAMLEAARIRDREGSHLQRRLMTVVAAALALVIVVTLVVTAQRFHPRASVPAAAPVQIKAPMIVTAPGVGVCAAPCSLYPPGAMFVSATVGWFSESVRQSECNTCNKTVLFRTDDGGFTWKAQLGWNGAPAYRILASPDGREVLVLSSRLQDDSTELLHSTDGGAHWTFKSGPPGIGSPFGTNSVQFWYFLNPREGWVLAPTCSCGGLATVADLFHTSDSGAHWSMTRIDAKAEFNRDVGWPVHGAFGPPFDDFGPPIVFRDSSTGWFVPAAGWDIYMTQDGGRSWQAQSLVVPVGVKPDLTPLSRRVQMLPNGRDGVLIVDLSSNFGASASPVDYVYTTSDGGRHWSNPTSLPEVALPAGSGAPPATPMFHVMHFDVIDATNWMAWPFEGGGLMRTSDAGQHWDFMPANPNVEFSFFGFVDPLHGWATFSTNSGTFPEGPSSGVVLYWTTDGGVTWSPRSLPEPAQ